MFRRTGLPINTLPKYHDRTPEKMHNSVSQGAPPTDAPALPPSSASESACTSLTAEPVIIENAHHCITYRTFVSVWWCVEYEGMSQMALWAT